MVVVKRRRPAEPDPDAVWAAAAAAHYRHVVVEGVARVAGCSLCRDEDDLRRVPWLPPAT